MSRESVIVMRIPVTVRGEATQAAVLCRYLLTMYWRPVPAWLVSPIQYSTGLYTVQYTAQAAAEEEEYGFLCN